MDTRTFFRSFEPDCAVAIETRLEALGKAVMEGYCEVRKLLQGHYVIITFIIPYF